MRISVPTEIKNNEYRVALTPSGVNELVRRGHSVFVQSGAGEGSLISDDDYKAQGAVIVPDAETAWGEGELLLKVKEPIAAEYQYLRSDQVLFTYLHLAADRPLTEILLKNNVTAIAYETVQLDSGMLPLLYPMSEVAGCLAPQLGAYTLLRPSGGRGVLMGAIGGVHNAKVVVIGGGTAGQNAANIALGMGANVTILDTDLDKLRSTFWRYQNQVQGIASNSLSISEQVLAADLVVGSVLIPGAKAPKLVTNDLVSAMKPGSVLVDIAIDQGGCFEDSHPTTHADPVFEVHKSLFYCVANMPGAVPNTSTFALTNATLPYVARIAKAGWRQACKADQALALGLNTHDGKITCAGVAEAFTDLPSTDLNTAL
ncbi:MAG: alanine dehydrogenase [Actinomycetales bacterium]|nr:MAG: alanine dehydrogenase [Actinomycetales bacterium]